MGALTFDALLRSLKQSGPAMVGEGGGRGGRGGRGKRGERGEPGGRKKLDPVYYLHGDEDVLKDEAVRALVERALDPDTRDFNFDQRSVADLDPEAFHTLVNTPPMLAAARVVVLRGLEALKKTSKVRQELVRYLGSPNPTTLLILVHGAGDPPDPELARAVTTVAAEPLPPARVQSWVAHRAGLLKLELEPEAAELLVAAVGNDLGALARELEKLAAVAAESGRPTTRDDVTALVGVRRGETLNDLVDAALERRGADAARLVGPVLEQGGMSGVKALTALGTALVGTALARAELDGGAPRGRLEAILLGHLRATRPYGIGGWEHTAARWARWAGLWRARELRRAQRLALEADRALKSTTVTDARGILMQLVLAWAVSAREAA